MIKKLQRIHTKSVLGVRAVYKKITNAILTRPAASFFSVLGVLFLVIIVGSFVGTPVGKKTVSAPTAKKVAVHAIGSAPRIAMTAQVETSGVVKIVAQTSGIVQQVYKPEGSPVGRGDWILWISTNYQGGTAPTVLRQIAQKNYDFVKDNYDAQKNLIDRQREIADTVKTQSGDIREITNNSIADTKNLIELDQEIVDALQSQITALESTNTGGANDALILQSKQGKAGAQSAVNALKTALAIAEYQADGNNAPAGLASRSHDLTLAQLDLQQKSLDLNRELSLLNLRVAQISEGLMYPASPVDGVVERVYVTPGQNVSSGTVLATITGTKKASSIVLLAPEAVAKSVSRLEPSIITAGSETFELPPVYISTQPTDGSLYSIIYRVPADKEPSMMSGGTVRVSVPVGGNASTRSVPVIPIDAVYQTQTDSYVYAAVKQNGGTLKAEVLPVELGTALGSFVEVTRGISADTVVIVSRTVVAGDTVTIE